MGCVQVHKKVFAFFLGFGVKLHLRAQEGFCLVGCVHVHKKVFAWWAVFTCTRRFLLGGLCSRGNSVHEVCVS